MFFTRLTQLCSENKISVSELIRNLNLSSGSVTKWKNGVLPKSETIIKLADYFNISTDFLLGKSDIKNSKNASLKFVEISSLSLESQQELLKFKELLEIKESAIKTSNEVNTSKQKRA